MFKFVKEDIGMYVIFSVAGAGVGLLVGSVVAAKMVRDEFELVTPDVDEVKSAVSTYRAVDEDTPEEVERALKKVLKDRKENVDVGTNLYRKEPWWEYLTAMQANSLDIGIITEDEAIGYAMENGFRWEDEDNKRVDYATSTIKDPEPGLDDVDILDDRFVTYVGALPTALRTVKQRHIVYDQSVDMFYQIIEGNREVPLTEDNLYSTMDETAVQKALDKLVIEENTIFVQDLTLGHVVKFTLREPEVWEEDEVSHRPHTPDE